MEIGHNILHGQWDWMRDPKIHSTTWEWDMASPAEQWKHSHNELHHTYTNVVGKDNDLGYGIMRVDEDQPWQPFHLGQPLWSFINACFFEYGIAAYDLELAGTIAKKRTGDPEFRARAKAVLRKIGRQVRKDYVVHPLLSGPSFLSTLAANFTANIVRNLWSDRKSTRLNSSHANISYAVFCLKKKYLVYCGRLFTFYKVFSYVCSNLTPL